MKKIKPLEYKYKNLRLSVTDYLNDTDNGIRLQWCYVHGRAQEKLKYDCFLATWDNMPKNVYMLPKFGNAGIYECSIEGVPSTFYYWHDEDGCQHGLACYNSDKEGNSDALYKYNNKFPHL